jgi:hypothetical protein
MKKIFLKFLKQKTTWAAIVGVATAFGVKLAPGQSESIITIGVLLSSLCLALFDESKAKKE